MNLLILLFFLLLSSSGIIAFDPRSRLDVLAASSGISLFTIVSFHFHRMRRTKKSSADDLYEDIKQQFEASYTPTPTVFETPTAVTTMYSRPAENGAAITANGCTTPLTKFLQVTYAFNGSIINVERIVGYRPLPDDLDTVKNSSVNCTLSSLNLVNGTNVVNETVIMANTRLQKGYNLTGTSTGVMYLRDLVEYIRTRMEPVCLEVTKLFKKVHKGFLKNVWGSLTNLIPTKGADAICTLLNMGSFFLLSLTIRGWVKHFSKATNRATGLKLWSFSVTVFYITCNFTKTAVPAVGNGLLLILHLAWIVITLPKAVILQEARRRELVRQSRATQTEGDALAVDSQSIVPIYTVASTSPDLPVVVAPLPTVEDTVDADEGPVDPPLNATVGEDDHEPTETTAPQSPPGWQPLFPGSVYRAPEVNGKKLTGPFFANSGRWGFNRPSPQFYPSDTKLIAPIPAFSSTAPGPDDSQSNVVPTCTVAEISSVSVPVGGVSNALETVTDESPLDVINALKASVDRLLDATTQEEASMVTESTTVKGEHVALDVTPQSMRLFDLPETRVKSKTSGSFVESDTDSEIEGDSHNGNGNDDINHDIGADDDTISDGGSINFSPPPDLGPNDDASQSNVDFLNADGDHDAPQVHSSPPAESVLDTPCRQRRRIQFATTEDGSVLTETFRFSMKEPPVARITDWVDAPEDVEEQDVVEEQQEPDQPRMPAVVEERQEPVPLSFQFQGDVVPFVQQPEESVPVMAEAQHEPAQLEMPGVIEGQQRLVPSLFEPQQQNVPPQPQWQQQAAFSQLQMQPQSVRCHSQGQQAPSSFLFGAQQECIHHLVEAQQEPAQPTRKIITPRTLRERRPAPPQPGFEHQWEENVDDGPTCRDKKSRLSGEDIVNDEPNDDMMQDVQVEDGDNDTSMDVDSNEPTLIDRPFCDPVLQHHWQPAPVGIPQGAYVAADGVIELGSYKGHQPSLQPPPRPGNASGPTPFILNNGPAQGQFSLQPPPRPSNASGPTCFNLNNGPGQGQFSLQSPLWPSNESVPDYFDFTKVSGQGSDAMDERDEIFLPKQGIRDENTPMMDEGQDPSYAGVNFGHDIQQDVAERDDEMTEPRTDAPSVQNTVDLPPEGPAIRVFLDIVREMEPASWASMDISPAMTHTANGRIVGNLQWMAANPGYFNFVQGAQFLEGPQGQEFLEEYGYIAMEKALRLSNAT
ncbi:hypothetical protein LTR10_022054 [Elasticomyces elasticus]|uniref:Uncharacterized protein n=1 Tax=Exophiala sideris TaxID=1016849 RepID=A0ABR0JMG0_9EURO|nr:hypothetical protein LTR10_022054 [Elasticomyces elasticus]KAK5036489.1 hypothetical protein LTS07_002216 [Exophiala sideris]KAK5041682.1 hypothetical protein LTR13_002349 [Exophiala sideris]KAK5066872.1 hypothetical protein LTR69_002220 [Exophiala sideris]KAK5184931.1 hypothetical protein LTR44_002777 [Eurotiomycetes sp. CCFEE 6388]